MQEYPRKDYYKLSEVCQYTDTQPYVLRFWENEFPQLSPGRSVSGQPVYRKRDIDLVCRIKELLYEQEYTLAGARRKLATELSRGGGASRAKGKSRTTAQSASKRSKKKTARETPRQRETADKRKSAGRIAAAKRVDSAPASTAVEIDTVPRQRYQDAVDEIDHLRLALKEADKQRRKAESAAAEAREQGERRRACSERAIARLEQLARLLS